MIEIQQLFSRTETLSYPHTMIKVVGNIEGRAFFPGGKGTFENDENISNKSVMILGQDFDCETNYLKTLAIGNWL